MKSAAQPTILFAGPEPAFADLARRCESRGLNVALCADGNLALQQALEIRPDLLLIDTALPAIPAARLAQILRTNRKGSELAIAFVGAEGEEIEGFVRHRDRFFPRPLNLSQISAFIDQHFSRIDRAQALVRQQKIEGNLDQLSLVDLLQVFALNHKSGSLALSRGAQQGAIFLDGGQISNALLGRVEGEKALYRLIGWSSGTFRFSPGSVAGEARISAPTDHLLMEGLRLGDEFAAQAESLPAFDARLALRIPRENLPQGLRPATREILLKLEYYPRVGDLLDQCPYPDLQILQVLRVLREKGVVAESRDAASLPTVPLLAPAEILFVHQALFGSGRLVEHATARLVVLSTSAEERRDFLRLLGGIPEFAASGLASDDPLLPVELGRLQLSESFVLRLVCVPAQGEMEPIWPLVRRHLFGLVSLAPAGALPAAERYFSAKKRTIIHFDAAQALAPDNGGRQAFGDLLTRLAAPLHDATTTAEAP